MPGLVELSIEIHLFESYVYNAKRAFKKKKLGNFVPSQIS